MFANNYNSAFYLQLEKEYAQLETLLPIVNSKHAFTKTRKKGVYKKQSNIALKKLKQAKHLLLRLEKLLCGQIIPNLTDFSNGKIITLPTIDTKHLFEQALNCVVLNSPIKQDSCLFEFYFNNFNRIFHFDWIEPYISSTAWKKISDNLTLVRKTFHSNFFDTYSFPFKLYALFNEYIIPNYQQLLSEVPQLHEALKETKVENNNNQPFEKTGKTLTKIFNPLLWFPHSFTEESPYSRNFDVKNKESILFLFSLLTHSPNGQFKNHIEQFIADNYCNAIAFNLFSNITLYFKDNDKPNENLKIHKAHFSYISKWIQSELKNHIQYLKGACKDNAFSFDEKALSHSYFFNKVHKSLLTHLNNCNADLSIEEDIDFFNLSRLFIEVEILSDNEFFSMDFFKRVKRDIKHFSFPNKTQFSGANFAIYSLAIEKYPFLLNEEELENSTITLDFLDIFPFIVLINEYSEEEKFRFIVQLLKHLYQSTFQSLHLERQIKEVAKYFSLRNNDFKYTKTSAPFSKEKVYFKFGEKDEQHHAFHRLLSYKISIFGTPIHYSPLDFFPYFYKRFESVEDLHKALSSLESHFGVSKNLVLLYLLFLYKQYVVLYQDFHLNDKLEKAKLPEEKLNEITSHAEHSLQLLNDYVLRENNTSFIEILQGLIKSACFSKQ